MKTTASFKCIVNRDLSFERMIAAGNYDLVGDISASRFPIRNSGSVETSFELICFDYDIEPDEAVIELDKHGLRPADITELLAFGAAFPKEQSQYLIVELSSITEYDGRLCVACLEKTIGGRNIRLVKRDAPWIVNNPVYRFLAVHA